MANISPDLHIKELIAILASVKQCKINRISDIIVCSPQTVMPFQAVKNL